MLGDRGTVDYKPSPGHQTLRPGLPPALPSLLPLCLRMHYSPRSQRDLNQGRVPCIPLPRTQLWNLSKAATGSSALCLSSAPSSSVPGFSQIRFHLLFPSLLTLPYRCRFAPFISRHLPNLVEHASFWEALPILSHCVDDLFSAMVPQCVLSRFSAGVRSTELDDGQSSYSCIQ